MSQWQSENWSGQNNPNGTYNSVRCGCAICGKTYTQTPRAIAHGQGKFCSRKCKGVWLSQNKTGAASPFWRGGKAQYRGPNWKQQRNEARKRDKYQCQHCGIHEKKLDYKLHVHHIVAFRSFGLKRYEEANRLTNLISFCRPCHKRAEYNLIPIQPRLL